MKMAALDNSYQVSVPKDLFHSSFASQKGQTIHF